ncbi:hypothetical protein SAMN04488574_11652 [Bacillus sp. 71mf]|nr:hypothetical protein SAMN04488574_11652 [Bacillus sp. 71mf]SFT19039.1 hypothetical protein SAMN04488145_1189 [Bacillus sp. 103mf]
MIGRKYKLTCGWRSKHRSEDFILNGVYVMNINKGDEVHEQIN